MKKLFLLAFIATLAIGTSCNSEDFSEPPPSGCKLTAEKVAQIKKDDAAGTLSEEDKKVKTDNPDCFK